MTDSILSNIAAHWKASVVGSTVIAGIGLMANQVTAPKVFAVAIFLSDWNMLLSWEWWVRTIFVGIISALFFWWQRRYFKKQLSAQMSLVAALRGELRHADLMIATMKTQINVLERK